MPIYLDDRPLDVDETALGRILQAAQRLLEPLRRIVVEVKLNGQSLVGPQLGERQEELIESAELRLYSADPNELALSTLEQVRHRLDEAREAQQQAAEQLQGDRLVDAMGHVSRMVEVWQQTHQAVQQSAALVGGGPEEQPFWQDDVARLVQDLTEQLRELRDLLKASDTVGLADALAYEWPETAGRWEHAIDELIAVIEQKSGS